MVGHHEPTAIVALSYHQEIVQITPRFIHIFVALCKNNCHSFFVVCAQKFLRLLISYLLCIVFEVGCNDLFCIFFPIQLRFVPFPTMVRVKSFMQLCFTRLAQHQHCHVTGVHTSQIAIIIVDPAIRYQSSPELLKGHFSIPFHLLVLIIGNALAIIVQPTFGKAHKKSIIIKQSPKLV